MNHVDARGWMVDDTRMLRAASARMSGLRCVSPYGCQPLTSSHCNTTRGLTCVNCPRQVLEHVENEANRAAILRSVEALGL